MSKRRHFNKMLVKTQISPLLYTPRRVSGSPPECVENAKLLNSCSGSEFEFADVNEMRLYLTPGFLFREH